MGTEGRARTLGRYVLLEEFASGGMASVHFGRREGDPSVVAIKQLHPQHAKDPAFVSMLLDEARLAERIHHPNVAPLVDVVATDGEVFLVMEYVHGESLALLLHAVWEGGGAAPLGIVSSVVVGMLRGLGAAHAATSETGAPLGIVHRDVSPENVLVGVDGRARVVDFGIALALGRSRITRDGALKGKLGYMAPELLEGGVPTRHSDMFSAGVVAWEALVGRRLFTGQHEGAVLAKVLQTSAPRPSEVAEVPRAVDAVVMRALSHAPWERFATADDFATALERVLPPADEHDVGAWVRATAKATLDAREERLEAIAREVRASRVETTRTIEVLVPDDPTDDDAPTNALELFGESDDDDDETRALTRLPKLGGDDDPTARMVAQPLPSEVVTEVTRGTAPPPRPSPPPPMEAVFIDLPSTAPSSRNRARWMIGIALAACAFGLAIAALATGESDAPPAAPSAVAPTPPAPSPSPQASIPTATPSAHESIAPPPRGALRPPMPWPPRSNRRAH